MVVTNGLEEGEKVCRCLIGIEFQFCKNRVLKTGFTTMWIHLTILNCTLNNGKDG